MVVIFGILSCRIKAFIYPTYHAPTYKNDSTCINNMLLFISDYQNWVHHFPFCGWHTRLVNDNVEYDTNELSLWIVQQFVEINPWILFEIIVFIYFVINYRSYKNTKEMVFIKLRNKAILFTSHQRDFYKVWINLE